MGISRRLGLSAGLLFLGASFLFGAPVVTVPNLVGYWRLDETASPAADDSGGNNNGTWVGTGLNSAAVPPAGPPGIGFTNPNCVLLNGVDQYVDLGTSAALAPTAAITVAAWVNPATVAGEKKAVAKWADTPTGASSFLLSISGDTALFAVQTTAMTIAQSGAATIQATTWQHVVGTYDGANVRLYINGTERAAPAATGAIATTTVPVRIGCGSGATIAQEEPFAGSIDDVRIYNVALSTTQITALYNGALPAAPTPTVTSQVGSVDISWPAAAGATSYDVQRGNALGGPFTTLNSQTTLTYNDPSGTVDVTYYYRVVATNVVGNTASTPAQPGTNMSPPPRTNDHEEGFNDGNCSCGSTVGASGPAGLLGLLVLALLLRRRG